MSELKKLDQLLKADPFDGLDPQNAKLEKFKRILQLVDESVSRKEFSESIKVLIDSVKQVKQDLATIIDKKIDSANTQLDNFLAQAEKTLSKIESDNESGISNIKKWALDKISTLYAQSNIDKLVSSKLKEVDDKLSQVDIPDTSTIALEASKLASNELLSLIPSKIALEEEIPKFGENIVDAINLLPTDNDQDKIAIEHIRGLRDELDRILKTAESKVVMGGGSVGKQNMYYYDLTPYLDGVTSTFSLPAFARILKVETFSAAVLRPSIDWTADSSNHTLTFTSEIDPAVYLRAGQTTLVYYAI